jgi:hypothetical protein
MDHVGYFSQFLKLTQSLAQTILLELEDVCLGPRRGFASFGVIVIKVGKIGPEQNQVTRFERVNGIPHDALTETG